MIGIINKTIYLMFIYRNKSIIMEDVLKNLIYQGLGVVAITRNKVEKAVNDMVDKGKMTREEGRKLVDELSSESLKAGKETEEKLKNAIREFLEKSGIPSREEFESLKKRVVALEQQNREEI
jgi:polyhydroxyalkanoate synthesis regulator phasin